MFKSVENSRKWCFDMLTDGCSDSWRGVLYLPINQKGFNVALLVCLKKGPGISAPLARLINEEKSCVEGKPKSVGFIG